MVSAREKKQSETKRMEENPFVLEPTDHRRSGSSHNGGAQCSGGAAIARNWDCMLVMACNVAASRPAFSVTQQLT